MKVKAHEGEIHRLPSTKLTAVMIPKVNK